MWSLGVQVASVSRYWELTLGMEMGWGGGDEGAQRREESRMCHQDLLSPLGMGAKRNERLPKLVCYRAGDKTGGLDLEERRENVGLRITHLLPWPA